ncbi:site-2 protease family protein [Myxococcus sp. Y35]|uniref:M50 family metallopeptidase n=1 Tax=Pseudomyxococcus flavus TaxID=3115648 RepID=UPI003CF5F51F
MHYALVLLALGGLLTLHELGHLVAARMLGVRVPRFVFGFGPPLVSFRLWGTQYVVAAVPLGATAHLQGMNPHRADAEEAAGYASRGPLLRILIILAGPLANYAVALGILFALYTSGTHVVVPLTVGTVQPGSEAARAQMLPGDRIVQVAGQPLRNWSEFVEKVGAAPGVPLELAVERGGEPRTVVVRPRPDERGTGRIGVSQQYVYKAHGAADALSHSFTHTVNVASEGVALLTRMMRGMEDPDAASPGALVRQESADAMASGTDALLRTLVAASVVLALLTLLPVPGLDGGRILLLLIEAASGRRIPPRVETVAQTVGFLGIAIAVVMMATAEIRRALPARLRMDASPAAGTQAVAPSPSTLPDAGPGTVLAPGTGPNVGTAPGGPPAVIPRPAGGQPASSSTAPSTAAAPGRNGTAAAGAPSSTASAPGATGTTPSTATAPGATGTTPSTATAPGAPGATPSTATAPGTTPSTATAPSSPSGMPRGGTTTPGDSAATKQDAAAGTRGPAGVAPGATATPGGAPAGETAASSAAATSTSAGRAPGKADTAPVPAGGTAQGSGTAATPPPSAPPTGGVAPSGK